MRLEGTNMDPLPIPKSLGCKDRCPTDITGTDSAALLRPSGTEGPMLQGLGDFYGDQARAADGAYGAYGA